MTALDFWKRVDDVFEEMQPEELLPDSDFHSDFLADSPGRGPAGNPRNFKSMTDSKIIGVHNDLVRYGNDPEALRLCETAMREKGLLR